MVYFMHIFTFHIPIDARKPISASVCLNLLYVYIGGGGSLSITLGNVFLFDIYGDKGALIPMKLFICFIQIYRILN